MIKHKIYNKESMEQELHITRAPSNGRILLLYRQMFGLLDVFSCISLPVRGLTLILISTNYSVKWWKEFHHWSICKFILRDNILNFTKNLIRYLILFNFWRNALKLNIKNDYQHMCCVKIHSLRFERFILII